MYEPMMRVYYDQELLPHSVHWLQKSKNVNEIRESDDRFNAIKQQ